MASAIDDDVQLQRDDGEPAVPSNTAHTKAAASANDAHRQSLGSLLGMGGVKPVFNSKTSKASRTLNPLAQSQDRGLLFSLASQAEEKDTDCGGQDQQQQQPEELNGMAALAACTEGDDDEEAEQHFSGRSSFAATAPMTREQSFEDAQASFDQNCRYSPAEPASPECAHSLDSATKQPQQQPSEQGEGKGGEQQADGCELTHTPQSEQIDGLAALQQPRTPSPDGIDALSQLRMYDATPAPPATVLRMLREQHADSEESESAVEEKGEGEAAAAETEGVAVVEGEQQAAAVTEEAVSEAAAVVEEGVKESVVESSEAAAVTEEGVVEKPAAVVEEGVVEKTAAGAEDMDTETVLPEGMGMQALMDEGELGGADAASSAQTSPADEKAEEAVPAADERAEEVQVPATQPAVVEAEVQQAVPETEAMETEAMETEEGEGVAETAAVEVSVEVSASTEQEKVSEGVAAGTEEREGQQACDLAAPVADQVTEPVEEAEVHTAATPVAEVPDLPAAEADAVVEKEQPATAAVGEQPIEGQEEAAATEADAGEAAAVTEVPVIDAAETVTETAAAQVTETVAAEPTIAMESAEMEVVAEMTEAAPAAIGSAVTAAAVEEAAPAAVESFAAVEESAVTAAGETVTAAVERPQVPEAPMAQAAETAVAEETVESQPAADAPVTEAETVGSQAEAPTSPIPLSPITAAVARAAIVPFPETPAPAKAASFTATTPSLVTAATPLPSVKEACAPPQTPAAPQPTPELHTAAHLHTDEQGGEESSDNKGSAEEGGNGFQLRDSATAARLAHELGVALAMESLARSRSTTTPEHTAHAHTQQLSTPTASNAALLTPPFNKTSNDTNTPVMLPSSTTELSALTPPPITQLTTTPATVMQATAHMQPAPAAAHMQSPPAAMHSTPTAATPVAAQPMEEDVSMGEQYEGEGCGVEGEGCAFMPLLETTPSPGPASPVTTGQQSQRSSRHMQVGRDSIPLFVRDSFAVTDSVSLDRQSLNSLEPFGRSTQHNATAAAAVGVDASQCVAAPLGTLHEDDSFMEELPPKPLAELQRPSQAPGTLQRSAARAAKAASATGFDDHDLDDLPDDLPDPMMISPMPALPASSLQHEGHNPHKLNFTSPSSKPLMSCTTTPLHSSARKPHTPGALNTPLTDTATHTAAAANGSLLAHTPQQGGGGSTPRLNGGVTPLNNNSSSNNGRWTPRGFVPGAQGPKPPASAAPINAAPSPRLSKAAESSSLSLSAQRMGKTPTSARRTQLSNPTTYANNSAATPTPPSVAKPKTGMQTPQTLHARIATAATPVGQNQVPTAVMPTLPASLNTPMAMMQRLPMEMAVNAPFLDQGSPFSEMDFGMDTTNIAEEAKRLMQSLAGPGGQQTTGHAGNSPPANFQFCARTAALHQTTPQQMPSHSSPQKSMSNNNSCEGSTAQDSQQQQHWKGGSGQKKGPNVSPGQAGFLETQNRMLMERLVAAEGRAQVSEREVEQLRDQIKTMNFGDMLQESGAGDMEHEARLYAEEQLQASKAEVSGMQDTVRNMQQALSDTKATNSSQSAELKELRATSNADKQQLRQLLGQVAHLEAELATEREQSRRMDTELNTIRQRLTHVEATSEARGAETVRLARQRDEAQGSLKHSTDELIAEQLRGKQQVVEATKQATAMQASLTKLQSDKDGLKRDLASVYARMKASEGQTAVHKADVARLKQENSELVRMAEELMCSLEKERQKNNSANKA